jgi:hypothetical protein
VASVDIAPASVSLVVGAATLVVGRTVTWSVTPANKALISLLGILTPLGVGSVMVTATINGVQASTTITIVQK